MFDGLFSSLTLFDGLVFAVVLMSALMAFSRGFMRELATLAALFIASIATYFVHIFFRDQLAALLPEGIFDFSADLLIIAVVFLVVYILVRMVTGRFTKLIQGDDGINMIDRLSGMVFGVIRGLALPFIFAWLAINFIPADVLPGFISKSATYPYFERSASAFNASLPDFAAQADGIFDTIESGDDR